MHTPSRTRRALGYIYELLPVLAILFAAAAIAVAVNRGEAIAPGNPLFGLYLLAWLYVYFLLGWRRGGQTLGMRPWRLQLRDAQGGTPSWAQCHMRFAVALLAWLPLGAGHLWLLLDRQRRGWHDLLAGTRVVEMPRAPKDS